MAKTPNQFIAYLQDGTPVIFTHAVDMREAIRTGKMSMNPPNQPAPEPAPVPQGEAFDGIEQNEPAPVAEMAKKAKATKIARQGE